MGTTLELIAADGHRCAAYRADPPGKPRGGLLVVQEIFMTETAKFANVILPAASFLEKSGTFTNAERRVQRVAG